MSPVEELQKKNHIFGELHVVEGLTDPVQEQEVLEHSPYAFPGGDQDIVEQELHEGRVQCGEVIEVDDMDDSDDEDYNEDPDAHIT